MSNRIIALTADLLFASNIEATLSKSGRSVRTVEDVSGLQDELNREAADLVILDLHAGATAGAVMELCRPAGVPVLAFGRHTEAPLLRAAREAGCVEVVPRSTFVEQMTGLVERARIH